MTAVDILVPCKAFAEAKSRLAPRLDAAERTELCRWLLRHALDVAVAACPADRVHLISDDPAAAAIGRALGVDIVADPGGGLNAALIRGRDAAAPTGDLLVLPIDLPLASADAIQATAGDGADLVIAPDRHGRGTNLLRLSGRIARRFAFAFGPDSFALHREAAAAIGATVAVTRDPLLTFDIDEPADLDARLSMSRELPPSGWDKRVSADDVPKG